MKKGTPRPLKTAVPISRPNANFNLRQSQIERELTPNPLYGAAPNRQGAAKTTSKLRFLFAFFNFKNNENIN